MRSTWIFLFFLILIIIIIYIRYQNNDVVYVKSDIDNEYYLVRELDDRQQAANMLAKIKNNIITLTNYLYQNRNKNSFIDYEPYILQLNSRIKNVIIMESTTNSVYTSYSVNKGEQIVFCIRSKKIRNQFHKLNLIMYVVLHEIAHVACPEFGHTELFKRIFNFLTKIAVSIRMYQPINFSLYPAEYCGITITDSII